MRQAGHGRDSPVRVYEYASAKRLGEPRGGISLIRLHQGAVASIKRDPPDSYAGCAEWVTGMPPGPYDWGMSIAQTITACVARPLGLAEKLLEGVPPDRFARLTCGANGPIQANHPAFIYGHLALYGPRLVDMLGHAGSAAEAEVVLPQSYSVLFSFDAQCQDDPDGSIYPLMQEVVDHFFKGMRLAIEAVASCDDLKLLDQTPEPRLRSTFPTLAIAANFLLNDHLMFHLGQMSTWRRAEGLGSAM